MTIKFKKLNSSATTPVQGKEGDACWDLVATSITVDEKFFAYGTGIAIEVPEDHVGLLFPRSSVTNKDLILKNCTGIIDAGYRGELSFRFWKTSEYSPEIYSIGDRVGQIMIIQRPFIEWEEVKELSPSIRGLGGYGSTGK